jgi:hypothetical protein
MPTTYALNWDEVGDRLYETGTKNGVLYVYDNTAKKYGNGVAWSGLTAVTESPSGAEETALWADNIKYLSLRSAEQFGGTIEAYMFPPEWGACDGSAAIATGVNIGQQTRSMFGFVFKTVIGNDTTGNDYGYKIHVIYGATASTSQRSYATVNESPEAITFSWEFTTVPVNVPGFKPTSIVTIESTTADPTGLAKLEAALFGSDGGDTYTAADTTGGFEANVIYFERTGAGTEESPYVYTATTATTPAVGTTYYTNGAQTSHLLMPEEIADLFTSNVGNG